MSKITYSDKEYIYENASIPEINKITDGNMNEIKSVVNENDTRLTTAEGEIDTAQTDINNAEAVIGNETDTYSTSSTYALGDLVIYNSLLYKCTTAITVAEAWNSAKWTQIDLVNVSSGLKGKILWTNPNPTSSFPSQSITTIDFTNYDMVQIIFLIDVAEWARAEKSIIVNKNFNFKILMDGFIAESTSSAVFSSRACSILSNTNITFETGYNNVSNSGSLVRDYACIPIYIVGYKKGLFN